MQRAGAAAPALDDERMQAYALLSGVIAMSFRQIARQPPRVARIPPNPTGGVSRRISRRVRTGHRPTRCHPGRSVRAESRWAEPLSGSPEGSRFRPDEWTRAEFR